MYRNTVLYTIALNHWRYTAELMANSELHFAKLGQPTHAFIHTRIYRQLRVRESVYILVAASKFGQVSVGSRAFRGLHTHTRNIQSISAKCKGAHVCVCKAQLWRGKRALVWPPGKSVSLIERQTSKLHQRAATVRSLLNCPAGVRYTHTHTHALCATTRC